MVSKRIPKNPQKYFCQFWNILKIRKIRNFQESDTSGHDAPGRARLAWCAQVGCAHQGTLLGSFFISKILKYSKTDKNIFADFSESVTYRIK